MLRPELLPPRVDSRPLAALIQRAYDRMEAGESADDAAAELAERSGRRIDSGDLDGWFGSVDPEDVAAVLLRPPAHELRRLRLSRDELIQVARRFMPTCAEWDELNEQWWMALFEANVPHPNAVSLVYHPPDGPPAAEWDPTPEEVVDLALAYPAIEL